MRKDFITVFAEWEDIFLSAFYSQSDKNHTNQERHEMEASEVNSCLYWGLLILHSLEDPGATIAERSKLFGSSPVFIMDGLADAKNTDAATVIFSCRAPLHQLHFILLSQLVLLLAGHSQGPPTRSSAGMQLVSIKKILHISKYQYVFFCYATALYLQQNLSLLSCHFKKYCPWIFPPHSCSFYL